MYIFLYDRYSRVRAAKAARIRDSRGAECAARGCWVPRGRIYLLVVGQQLLGVRTEEHLPGVHKHLLGYGDVNIDSYGT